MTINFGDKSLAVLIMANGAHVPLGAPLDVPPGAPLDAELGGPAVSAQASQPEFAPVRGAAQLALPAGAAQPHGEAQPHEADSRVPVVRVAFAGPHSGGVRHCRAHRHLFRVRDAACSI